MFKERLNSNSFEKILAIKKTLGMFVNIALKLL